MQRGGKHQPAEGKSSGDTHDTHDTHGNKPHASSPSSSSGESKEDKSKASKGTSQISPTVIMLVGILMTTLVLHELVANITPNWPPDSVGEWAVLAFIAAVLVSLCMLAYKGMTHWAAKRKDQSH